MGKLWAEFLVAIFGVAFYLFALAAQVSGYISAFTGLGLFVLASALLVFGLWTYDPVLAVLAGIAASLVPMWLGRKRLRELFSRFPWTLRKPWVRKEREPAASTPPPVAPVLVKPTQSSPVGAPSVEQSAVEFMVEGNWLNTPFSLGKIEERPQGQPAFSEDVSVTLTANEFLESVRVEIVATEEHGKMPQYTSSQNFAGSAG